MRLLRTAQTSFTAGELDPLLAARVEVSRYYSGAALLRNLLVRPQGGVRRRPGQRHLTSLPDGLDGVRAIPFAFNTEQTYAFAFTAGTFRVWTNDGVLRATVTGCPWTAQQAARLNFAQSADTLLLFHPDLPPQRIRRGASHASWTLDAAPLSKIPGYDYAGNSIPDTAPIYANADSGKNVLLTAYQDLFAAHMVGWTIEGANGRARITAYLNPRQVTVEVTAPFTTPHPAGTITPSATTGAATITCIIDVFRPAMVGWKIAGNNGLATITAFGDGRTVAVDIEIAFANTTGTGGWRFAPTGWTLGEPVISASRGWPECGTFHAGRLYMGGLRSRPATCIASKVADFFNFDAGATLDDDGFMVTIDSDQVNAIHQMRSGKALQIFTSGAEYAVTVPPPITPGNVNAEEQSRRGIKRWTPVAEVDGATLFIQAGGAGLRQFLYVDLAQQYQAELLSLLSPHLIVDPVDMAARKGARQDDADHVLLVRADGQVTVLTTLRAQEIVAFTRWETDGRVRSACALQSGEVFLAVERAGSIRMEMWDEQCRMDASTRTSSATPFASVAGLSHLEGRTVGIIAGGAWQGTGTVTGGSIALPRAATSVEIGLPFVVEGETMPLEPRDATGALIGRKARVVRKTARVHETAYFTLDGQPLVLRRMGAAPAAPLDSLPPVFTGDLTIRGGLGWQERCSIRFRQDVPGPFTLLALQHQLAISD